MTCLELKRLKCVEYASAVGGLLSSAKFAKFARDPDQFFQRVKVQVKASDKKRRDYDVLEAEESLPFSEWLNLENYPFKQIAPLFERRLMRKPRWRPVNCAKLLGAPNTEWSKYQTYVKVQLLPLQSKTVLAVDFHPVWDTEWTIPIGHLHGSRLFEVREKGLLWDRLLGYTHVPLNSIDYVHGQPRWYHLDRELVQGSNVVTSTRGDTGNRIQLTMVLEVATPSSSTKTPTSSAELRD